MSAGRDQVTPPTKEDRMSKKGVLLYVALNPYVQNPHSNKVHKVVHLISGKMGRN